MNTQPLIERSSFPPIPAPLTELPFVADVDLGHKTERSFWNVPPTDDYGHACDVGRKYACDFMQYIKENQSLDIAGKLGWIALDMKKYADNIENGYAVGFFEFIEHLLYVAVTNFDHYAIAEEIAQRYAELELEDNKESGHD